MTYIRYINGLYIVIYNCFCNNLGKQLKLNLYLYCKIINYYYYTINQSLINLSYQNIQGKHFWVGFLKYSRI